MTDQQPHTPEPCDHHWKSYLQPKNAGLRWIRQCSQCGDFDADDLREQVAAAEQRGAIKALRDTADHIENEIEFVLPNRYKPLRFRRSYEQDGTGLTPEEWLRARADQIEGDDERN